MRVSKLVAAIVVSSLAVTPALAESASRLSVAKVANFKASTPSKKANRLDGTGTVVAVLAAAAVVGGAVIALDDDNSDSD